MVELANRICASSPLSVQACLAAVNGLVGSDDEAGWTATREAVASLQGTHDSEEGIRSFFEKRPPVWTGR